MPDPRAMRYTVRNYVLAAFRSFVAPRVAQNVTFVV